MPAPFGVCLGVRGQGEQGPGVSRGDASTRLVQGANLCFVVAPTEATSWPSPCLRRGGAARVTARGLGQEPVRLKSSPARKCFFEQPASCVPREQLHRHQAVSSRAVGMKRGREVPQPASLASMFAAKYTSSLCHRMEKDYK